MASILLCSTTQLIVFHFLFSLLSIPPSQQAFSLRIGKTLISSLFRNRKPLLISFRLLPNISTFTLSKILDHQIFYYLYDFCSTHKILTNCQFGFQPRFSIETALLSIVNSWVSSLISKKQSVLSFLILQKGLIMFLTSPYMTLYLRSTFPFFFCLGSIVSYKGCTQQVVINGSLSSKSQITSGTSQWCILWPLLFIIYINVLAKLPFLSSATLTLYPDDILLSQEISSPTSMSTVQSNINLIHYIVD